MLYYQITKQSKIYQIIFLYKSLTLFTALLARRNKQNYLLLFQSKWDTLVWSSSSTLQRQSSSLWWGSSCWWASPSTSPWWRSSSRQPTSTTGSSSSSWLEYLLSWLLESSPSVPGRNSRCTEEAATPWWQRRSIHLGPEDGVGEACLSGIRVFSRNRGK